MDLHVCRVGSVALSLMLAACEGTITSPGGQPAGTGLNDPDPGITGVAAVALAPARARRLSPQEIENSASDIFLAGKRGTASMPAEPIRHRYDNFYNGLTVSLEVADALQSFAQAIAAEVGQPGSSLFSCDVAAQGEAQCLHSFLEQYVLRTYRRPMGREDEDTLTSVFTAARTAFDFDASLGFVIEAMLQSPYFLFRTELGQSPRPGNTIRLSPYEVAAELSYFLWRTTPDTELLEHARAGSLNDEADRVAQTTRLLTDGRARLTFQDFLQQLLETSSLPAIQQVSPYDAFTPELARSMQSEVAAASGSLWDAGTGQLFASTQTVVDGPLAAIYGAPSSSAAGSALTLDPQQRRGVLTMPGVIAAHSRPSGFSPVIVGRFVRTRLLCQTLPDPPADAPPLPPAEAGKTVRDQFAQHAQQASCRSCHELMDPIGFAFEQFDSLGSFQGSAGPNGETLTAEGQLTGTDVDGPFVGAAELSLKLSQSQLAATCIASHVAELALGRDVTSTPRAEIDEQTLASALALGPAGQSALPQWVASIVASDSFVFRDASALP